MTGLFTYITFIIIIISFVFSYYLWHLGDVANGICAYKFLHSSDFYLPKEPEQDASASAKKEFAVAFAQRQRWSKWKGLYGKSFKNAIDSATYIKNPSWSEVKTMYDEAMACFKKKLPKGAYVQRLDNINPTDD